MTVEEIMNLINRSLFADLGYIAEDGRPAIRRVFCVWHNVSATEDIISQKRISAAVSNEEYIIC